MAIAMIIIIIIFSFLITAVSFFLLFILGKYNQQKMNKLRKLYSDDILLSFWLDRYYTPWKQDVNWKNIRLSEDVQDVFWTSFEFYIYVLCPGGISIHVTPKRLWFSKPCFRSSYAEGFISGERLGFSLIPWKR